MNDLEIRRHYDRKILTEAVRLFGFNYHPLIKREGSAYVYEGIREGEPCILKIVPGVYNIAQPHTISTEELIRGEIEFILYLAEHGVRLALPLRSVRGEWVESIHVTDTYCFLVYGFEKAPGFMYPDEDEVFFPSHVLTEWGRLHAVLHNLAENFEPSDRKYRRKDWDQDDRLEYWKLIPPEQTMVYQRYSETLDQLHALPDHPQVYGLVHGDFHHGNFFVAAGQIILFDFDAAHYFWFPGEISIPLYNILPFPFSDTVRRRKAALQFLSHFMRGYVQERSLDLDWFELLPLFLKYQEMIDYASCYKYWNMDKLSERRCELLKECRFRIEENIPVVVFEAGDLRNLLAEIKAGG